MVEIDQWSKPNIEQFAELAMGVLPREFHSTDELTPQARTVYDAGQRLWMRPTAGNFNDGESPESWRARAETLKEKGINGNGAGLPLSVQAKEVTGRLWSRPNTQRGGGVHRSGNRSDEMLLPGQALEVMTSLSGPRSPTTQTDGEPCSTPDLTSLRLSPLFDEWLLFGREMIGWTCVCPARALARAVAESPLSATLSAPIRRQPPSASCGSERSASGSEVAL